MFEGVGVQLAQHAVEVAAIAAQPRHFEQQLQQVRQGIEVAQGGAAKIITRRPVLGASLGFTGRQRRPDDRALLDHGHFDQADIVTGLTVKSLQRLLNVVEQKRRVMTGIEHLEQALLAKQLVAFVLRLEYAIGKQKNPVTQLQRVGFVVIAKTIRVEHAQWQVARYQRHALGIALAQHITGRQAAAPEVDRAPAETDVQQGGAAEHATGQDAA